MTTTALERRPGRPARRVDGTLGAAAERFARLTLKKSEQTQATYAAAYARFARWLAAREATPDPRPEAFTADALAEYLAELEQSKAPATVKKERAALNRLAKYFHQLGAIDATEILMIEGNRGASANRSRDALDAATWKRVKAQARARLAQGPDGRTSPEAAARDLALLLVLGEMGLRSEEARLLTVSAIRPKRSDGIAPWLRVHGKGDKRRDLPIPTEVADALLAWQELRVRLELDINVLFPRLGRRRRDGAFPDAGPRYADGHRLDDGELSGRGLRDLLRPILLDAGVSPALAHPHVLRHTYGTLFMRRPGARLEQLRELLGHASIETTSVYVHQTAEDLEAAVLARETPNALAADAERRRRRSAARRG